MVHLGILITYTVTPAIPIFIKVQLIQQVLCNGADKDVEAILWEREKYLQSQIFANVYDVNSVSDLYSKKIEGCRRK